MTDLPFAILVPGNYPPRKQDPSRVVSASKGADLLSVYLDKGELLYVDFETRGLNPMSDPNFLVVGLGISSESQGSIYFGSEPGDASSLESLYNICYLIRNEKLVAHNVTFDGMVMSWCLYQYEKHWSSTGKVQSILSMDVNAFDKIWANWRVCTYGLYRALAGEGWIGQKYGLKDAMEDLLGWTDTNEAERDEWLVAHGYSKRQSKNGVTFDRVNKGDMWRVPMQILGNYCMLDCEATYQLYTKVLEPAASRFAGLQHFHQVYFMDLVKHVTWQKMKGVTVLMDSSTGMLAYRDSLVEETARLKVEFFNREDVKPHLITMQQKSYEEFLLTCPEKKHKEVKALPTEPKKYNVSGAISKQWQAWEQKRDAVALPPVETASYIAWKEKQSDLLQQMEDFFTIDYHLEGDIDEQSESAADQNEEDEA